MVPLDVRDGWEDLPLVLDMLMFMVGLSGLPWRGDEMYPLIWSSG